MFRGFLNKWIRPDRLEPDLEQDTGAAPAFDVMGEEERLSAASERLNIPLKTNIQDDLDLDRPLQVPIQYFKRMGFVPLHAKDGVLTLAVNDPLNFHPVDELVFQMGYHASRWILSPLKEIQAAINLLFDQSTEDAERMVQDLGTVETEGEFSELEELDDLLDVNHEAPVIRLINVILTQAIRREASDIHIEPYHREVKVRFRLDGVLYEIFSLPKRLHAHMVSRVKVMADLDIAEKRIPQDGRLKIKAANKTVDIRVSIIPMAFGERIVLRLLDKTISLLGLGDMGMPRDNLAAYEKLIQRSSGIILVTGPTGSGKTTTLYASIDRINTAEKNIITIEDPIEYELKDVGQIQVNPKTDLTFAKGLRSILRHDPDIIMVGEIRDLETVEIAIQASLTGHLVLSTLHTNDAAGALTRLVDMGVEPFLIASSLLGVVAQRLVRKVCPDCGEQTRPDPATLEDLGLAKDRTFWKGKGCPSCVDIGYRGRTGIFELLIMDNEIRHLLTSGADSVTIKEAAVRQGMSTLFDDGLRKVIAGTTTLDEVMRVTQE